MSIELLYAIHFNGFDNSLPKLDHLTFSRAMDRAADSYWFGNNFTQGNLPPGTMPIDWVDADVNGTGYQTTTLYCRGIGGSVGDVEDLVEFFQGHEILWYKLILTPSNRILHILRCHSHSLVSHGVTNLNSGFPMFEYSFNSFVRLAAETDDGKYKTTSHYIDMMRWPVLES